MNTFEYYVLDVFSSERFKGNPLSVVFTGSDLPLTTYEKIAREFGYSETSFIYYSNPDKALKVRSFTPTGFEVGGAGHNLLGAIAAALSKGMKIFHEQNTEYSVIMKDERIFVSISQSDDLFEVAMLQKNAQLKMEVDPQLIAEALSLDRKIVSAGRLVPVVVETEVAHLMVPLNDLDALNKISPNKSVLSDMAGKYEFEGVYCFVLLDDRAEYFAEARFFNPGMGIDEDPATGSAAGPLAGYLFQTAHVQREVEYQILQGKKINHPSIIKFQVKNEGIWIIGRAVIVMSGTLCE